MDLDRRSFLGAASLLAAPQMLFAQAATERRFVFIIQRGAADGLNIVIPYAEPAYAKLRGKLAIDPDAALKLDGTFALHPALTRLRELYAGGEATFLHAVASPYRDRSHFDGQNVLETGGEAPYQLKDGWMNRLLGLLPRSGKDAIAFSPAVPLALQGAVDVTTYAPSTLPEANEDLLMRVEQLYAPDRQLRPLWTSALEARGMAGGRMGGGGNRQDAAALGRIAAGFLARADGPRVAMIETRGWDTHSGQDARLATQLRGLDGLVGALRDGMGAAWSQTVVLVATEFGRTVAVNGTGGTDHGTAAAAMVIGGAVQGGRIVTDWPGLAPGNLFEGRDLQPTLALDSLIAAACAQAFRLDPEHTARVLFPEAGRSKPVPQLMRTWTSLPVERTAAAPRVVPG
ncbi:DUF1501 domain-containing protein [Hydrogenophaga sp.]|uniref:DUF1501 domain-containing protein n=1 Tax=Hydrogenophaga sp. TaxID=1904254 RepID=UPI0025C26113|nr:DUF1501 domain-containing protein [Hydrogenophaga sp.]MBT9463015.1 DUF1501 domain-containing protein [Hydrogenophaga sp.]